ncbi:S1C family serine protease [Desulforamulus hydrothermalis]|uniref:Peptidase S1 and S6, chymotrypsin/Hap n=1 Tax=Desulforamulus hydrothermalis Lam5 = DSM 18033 TaxID=1121428 RepID=K8EJD2_9FIRM|nr:trypsin-like peptidase domain-containing protein [Desulforamulus hydrothermalis]CCO08696.1 Peptidase S1 and S6, chymotrypsin/Hap [Desulforamulus hydrothermalis Lam5 = DSM 18033]SHG69427.1 Do/DeqQ family serine protease [Desulforamulus hydrothermalis Lam5 = DSM 18033]
MSKWRNIAVFTLLLAFLSGIMFTAGCTLIKDIAPKQNTAGSQEGVADAGVPGVGPNTIADIVEKAGPAVVKITTVVEVGGYQNPLFNDPFFRQFFGLRPEPQYQSGLGSGFIISKDGYILTNEHVIEGAQKISVLVKGHKKPFAAKLVGADPALDLAVLKIDGSDLPVLTLGDSNRIRVGNWVIAIGSPFGLEDTVTIGVISAKERPLEIDNRTFEHLLQTDASINPGNSGGPLLNLNGEVIGINTAINAQAQGIGFAIPTSTVKEVINELIEQGKVKRPWIGVQIQPVTPDIANYLGYEGSAGAVVYGVVAGGPAHKAGLRQGDIILSIDGSKVATPDELIKIIQKKKAGSHIVLEVYRQGKTIKVTVQTEERPAEGR